MANAKKLQAQIESTLVNSLHILAIERTKSGKQLDSRDLVDVYDMLKSCAANLAQIISDGGEQ